MIFAILFVIAFLIGLAVYSFSEKWIVAVLVNTSLFVVTTLSDTAAKDSWGITVIFGLPIIFVASLFGAYVVELRRGVEQTTDQGQQLDSECANAVPPEDDEPDNSVASDDSNESEQDRPTKFD